MKGINIWLLFSFILFGLKTEAQIIPVSLNLNTSYHLEISSGSAGSSYNIETTGTDPNITSGDILLNYNPDSVYFISLDYLAPQGLDDLQIYFGPPFSESNSLRIGKLAPASSYKKFNINIQEFTGEWTKSHTQLRFDFSNGANQKISIKDIQLRKPTPSEIDYPAIHKNRQLIEYLNSRFSSKINTVCVNKDEIIITGTIAKNQPELYLCELRMFDETSITSDSFAYMMPIEVKKSSFEITADRFISINDTGYDRIYSRWVIASKNSEGYQIQSFAHYPDDLTEAAYHYLSEEKPATKKGLAAFVAFENTTPELTDLGIKNITVNISLPELISFTSTNYTYNFSGETYYFNSSVVSNYDKTLKTCSDHNALVSAILLIPRDIHGSLKSIFIHPKANAGIYSMANLTSLTGLNYYAATIGFLAERYSRPNKEFGRIVNWIVHNEVDNGNYWTNAGTTQMETYTELYDRSLRTVYYTIRQYNPASKVFLSLTNHWASAEKAIYFQPKKMLEAFNVMSKEQGDYEWGIAYHPYPRNAFDAHAWNDKDATLDLNTSPYITPKNIELIDEWMRMKSHLYNGLKVRSLLFSEQGVHSASYKPDDLILQAAGLAYMWKKFKRLPSLEAFDYHRQVDNLNEGGLLLGLWTVKEGTKGTPDYKKPAWYVYQKAGTPAEDSAFAFALPMIGVTHWEEIFNPLKGEVMPLQISFFVTENDRPVNDILISFNGETHKTDENGKAIFYNVASMPEKRSIVLCRDGKIVYRSKGIVITKEENINIKI